MPEPFSAGLWALYLLPVSWLGPWTSHLAFAWTVSLDLEPHVSSDSECCLCCRRPGLLAHGPQRPRTSVFNPTPPELSTEVKPPGPAPGGATHTQCNDLAPILQWKWLPLQPSRAHNLNGCTWQLCSKTQILNSFPQPNKMHVLGAQDQPPS